MPGLYKIGCTERSPHARARQLSASSGVPQPFHVLLYIEVDDCQRVELQFHQQLADFRATSKREFFRFGPAHMGWLWWVFRGYQNVLAFAHPDWGRYAYQPKFPDDYVETWIWDGGYLCMPDAAPIDGPEIEAIA